LLVEIGYAEATGYVKAFAYCEDFTAAADEARKSGMGRWKC